MMRKNRTLSIKEEDSNLRSTKLISVFRVVASCIQLILIVAVVICFFTVFEQDGKLLFPVLGYLIDWSAFLALFVFAVEGIGAVSIFRKNHSMDELSDKEKKKYHRYIFTSIICVLGICLIVAAYIWYTYKISTEGFFVWNILFYHLFPGFGG